MPPKRRRSRRPRRTPPTSPLAHIPWQPIRNRMAPLTRLQPEEEDRIDAASLRILEEIGIAFMDPEALDLWIRAGAQVDLREQIVRIDRGLLQELVSRAPQQFTWRARNPARHLHIGGSHLNFAPNGGVVFAQDLDRGRRPGQMQDYLDMLKLVQSCNVLHLAGEQLVVPHDVPVSFRHLQRSLAALTLTDKAYMEAAHGRIISEDALQMAEIVFGGDIRSGGSPVVGSVINASSPLRYDERMIGGMLAFARAGQALIITPFILAGAMSPISMAAAVAQQNAEALAGIAFTQLVRPGTPVIYGGFATNINMRSGSPAFGTPEGAWATIAGAQMARRYRLPFRSSGSLNTSNLPDAQAAYQTMWSSWPAVLAHTNFLMHAVGWLEGGLTVGYEKIVIDMENLAMFQHFFQDVEISDETLAVEMIAEVGPGGHHFGTAHTQARYESEFFNPFLADGQNHENWAVSGGLDASQRANQLWKKLLENYRPPEMESAVREELQAFVERRQRELEGVELYA